MGICSLVTKIFSFMRQQNKETSTSDRRSYSYINPTEITPEVNLEDNSENSKVSQGLKAFEEKNMKSLTIDTKTHCYVIDANHMNNLQQNVATTFVFDKGNFDIKITGGRYSYSNTKTPGEPFVLLWIYGDNGSKFINKNTGLEVGATWTTLNGYNDTLKLEVKERAVLNALFFDFNKEDNSGSINLLITSDKQFFNPVNLTVDSKQNCYLLDDNYLSTLKQSGSNFVELNPGNYRIKIRQGNATYWSDHKKFNIEPWALILLKGGKFVTKLTGIETEETWVSLNGLKDEVVLEVKEKTTLTGLFFDTYKEDNEGQIILEIKSLSADELTEAYRKQENHQFSQQQTGKTVTGKTVITTEGNGGSVSRELVGNAPEFTFHFNEEEFKKKWEEQLQQINTSIGVIDETDVTLEAKYWDQLEQWLLKHYEKHFKNLSVEVAKVKFSMDAYLQQVEFSFNQHLQGLSGYLERILQDKINRKVTENINQQINQYIDQTFEQRIRNNVSLIINNIVNQQELNQYIERQVNQQINQTFEQNIRNNVNLITQTIVNNNTEFNQYVSQQIDNNFEEKVRNNIELIINNIVNKQEFNHYIDQQVNQQIDNTFEQKIHNNINLITQNIANSNEFNHYVSQEIDNSFEQKIQNHIQLITQNIINDNDVFNQYLDQRLEQTVNHNTEVNHAIVNVVANSTEINNKINNIRQEWNETFISLVTEQVDELINVIGGREGFARLITQRIVNNNIELNQYIDHRLQHNVTNNQVVINQIFDNEQITQKIQNIFHNNSQIHQRIESVVLNSNEINNRMLNFIVNSAEINNKIHNIYRDVDIKIENVRNEWNQTFINLVRQYVDEMINIIGDRDSFNILIANLINVKVDEILNQILRIRNELTVIINNADRHLYEWTLGELMAIKGCLTDRQALVEQLVTFSSELRVKLDSTNCVDINTFKPFKPLSTKSTELPSVQAHQLGESNQ